MQYLVLFRYGGVTITGQPTEHVIGRKLVPVLGGKKAIVISGTAQEAVAAAKTIAGIVAVPAVAHQECDHQSGQTLKKLPILGVLAKHNGMDALVVVGSASTCQMFGNTLLWRELKRGMGPICPPIGCATIIDLSAKKKIPLLAGGV